MNELTEFEKLRLFFDKIDLNYTFIERDHTNQMQVFIEDLYVWDVVDLKRKNYIELMCRTGYRSDDVYCFATAKEFVRYILERFCFQRW